MPPVRDREVHVGWLSQVASGIAGRFVVDQLGRDLDELSESLRSGSAADRLRAVERLRRLPGDDATALLLSAFRDESPEVRATAATASAQRAPADLVPGLGALLDDREPSVRLAAVGALREIGSPATTDQATRSVVPPRPPEPRAAVLVAQACSDADAGVRLAAMQALPVMSSRGVELALAHLEALPEESRAALLPPLRSALAEAAASPDAEHRRAAVAALALHAGAESLPVLLHSLEDDDAGVRAAAVEAVASIAPDEAFGDLVARLEDPSDDAAARAIDGLMAARSRGALVAPHDDELHEHLVRVARHREGKRRRRAAWALGLMGRVASVAVLAELLSRSDAELAASAAESLGRLGDPRAVAPLIQAMQSSPEWGVRAAAATALGRLADPRGIVALVHQLFAEPDARGIAAVDAALDAACGDRERSDGAGLGAVEPEVRRDALRLSSGDARLARCVLASLLDSPDDACRAAAREQLQLLGLEPLRLFRASLALTDQPEDRRLVVIRGIASLRPDDAPSLLVRLLHDANEPPEAWRASVAALAALGTVPARQALQSFRGHANPIIKDAVERALGGTAG